MLVFGLSVVNVGLLRVLLGVLVVLLLIGGLLVVSEVVVLGVVLLVLVVGGCLVTCIRVVLGVVVVVGFLFVLRVGFLLVSLLV